MMKKQPHQLYQLVFRLLLLFAVTTTLLITSRTQRTNAQQQFDAAATVTVLVQTRTAIIATVTASASTHLGTKTDTAKSTPLASNPTTVPFVEVRVKGLNIRSGPGTGYGILGSANAGQRFMIMGQSSNCAWLKVGDLNQPTREVGWISGASQYSTYSTACAQIAQATAPPLLPTFTPRPAAPTQPNQNSGTGCYTLENQLAFQVTIKLSRADGWGDTFELAPGATREYCAPAGNYNYTISLPPPLGSISGVLTIKAGDRFYLPLKL